MRIMTHLCFSCGNHSCKVRVTEPKKSGEVNECGGYCANRITRQETQKELPLQIMNLDRWVRANK